MARLQQSKARDVEPGSGVEENSARIDEDSEGESRRYCVVPVGSQKKDASLLKTSPGCLCDLRAC